MRARSIKPGLLANEILGTADPLYTLLFEALWMMADREGRLEDRPLRIKAQAFPYRDGIDCDAMLTWLAQHQFITRYAVSDQRFIQVLKFGEHQHPHVKEPPSKIPAPDPSGASTVSAPDQNGSGTSVARLTPSSLTPDSGLRTADSSSLRSPSVAQKRDAGPVEDVFEHWRQTHGHFKARLDPKRRRRIVEALKHFTAEQLRDAISGYLNSPHHMGTDPKGSGIRYDDIELFLRDTSHVEAGLRLFAHPPRPPPRAETAGERLMRTLNGNDDRVIEHAPELAKLPGH